LKREEQVNRISVVLGFGAALLLSAPAIGGAQDDIVAADKAFSELSVAKGSNAAFLAYMADDARIFGTGNEAPIFGKAEAAKRFQTSSNGDQKLNVLSWVPDNAEVSGDGTVGYSGGHWLFEGAPDAKGNRLHLTGRYVTVWRKVGSDWKFIADMGTTDQKPEK
jgi:ketosteroid isomerase-like protein